MSEIEVEWKKRKGGNQAFFVMSQWEYDKMERNNMGVCFSCGFPYNERIQNLAKGEECERCGDQDVFGITSASNLGRIIIEEEET